MVRTLRASEMSATKNVLQPAFVRARATGSIPQPYPSALITAAHSDGIACRPNSSQFAAIAERLIVRKPPASAFAGPPAGAESAGKSGCKAVSVMALGLAVRALAVHAGRTSSLGALGKVGIARERGKSRYCRIELQLDSSGRPMALFADDDLGLAMHFIRFGQPFRELVAV